MNLRPPSVIVSTHTSGSNAVAFQSAAMPNARMSLETQSVYSFSVPPRPLRTAPSRFPNTNRFGSCPPLIRMSVPAHKNLLVRNIVSMSSHRAISRARLYEVIESFNDWGGGWGRHKFVPVLGGDDTKVAPPGDLFDQPPGEMS